MMELHNLIAGINTGEKTILIKDHGLAEWDSFLFIRGGNYFNVLGVRDTGATLRFSFSFDLGKRVDSQLHEFITTMRLYGILMDVTQRSSQTLKGLSSKEYIDAMQEEIIREFIGKGKILDLEYWMSLPFEEKFTLDDVTRAIGRYFLSTYGETQGIKLLERREPSVLQELVRKVTREIDGMCTGSII